MTDPWLDVRIGDCRDVLDELPEASVHCVVTSPPYWGLRDYGHAGQLGLEPTPEEYVANMVDVFRKVRRVLRDDGTVWLNLGDSYATGNTSEASNGHPSRRQKGTGQRDGIIVARPLSGLASKQLVGIPWRVAFALQADGWYLRSDVIWCLSGGARVYARTQKGEMPTTLKDLVRLDPATVQLWNGERWTQVLGWSQAESREGGLEVELRNGERIGCTPHHRWPTQRGEVAASDLVVGDVIQMTLLPDPEQPVARALDDRLTGWLIGLYIAEGSRSGDTLQFAGHINDPYRARTLDRVADAYHGSVSIHQSSESGATYNVNGGIIDAIIRAYVSGSGSKGKHLHPRAWQRSASFLLGVLEGYLAGDGHYDKANDRWRLGFTKNDALAADLRTIVARVGGSLRLKRAVHQSNGRTFPGYRGEYRRHERNADGEVIAIHRSRARQFWHVGVADEPHRFALASGVLTSNSKPNPMPESVMDRPTKSHEYVFLMSKSPRYYFDQEAVREHGTSGPSDVRKMTEQKERIGGKYKDLVDGRAKASAATRIGQRRAVGSPQRNIRTVWTIATQPYPGAHFAVFPPALVEPCIKAGTSERGVCGECGAPWERLTEFVGPDGRSEVRAGTSKGSEVLIGDNMIDHGVRGAWNSGGVVLARKPAGWRPTCAHDAPAIPATVLDPFGGSGTVGMVANKLSRRAILIDLNPAYLEQIEKRNAQAPLGLVG